ncbi:MAG TPA: beta-ketoacyl-ACP synthase III [Candidatus Angelobacter sp.]|nr:beta-ketoacyl-ACP synthase III [Candidatus Angelobacter sp.]
MANLVRAKISALGTHVPPRLLTNADLEKMVETSNEWILERTGIRQRHIVEKGMATSDLAIEAAKEALRQRGLAPNEVEAIFLATVTPDMFFPATACIVQDKIGAKGAWGYDISAACSGFVYALQTAVKFVESGAHKKVMAIGADVMSSIINYQDRATCVIFGDGAGAVLVEPATDENCFIDFMHEVDGSGACSLYMPGGGSRNPSSHETVDRKMHYVHQDGQAVFKYAVRKMAETSEALLKRNGFTGKDVGLFVPHQANRRIIMSSAERLGLKEDRIIINIDEFGNTTAGTIPLALHSARQQGRLKKGDLVLIAAVGAGFTVGAALLRWAC